MNHRMVEVKMSMEHPKTISLLLEALQGLRRIEAMLRPMLVPKPEPIGRLLGQVVGGVESPARVTPSAKRAAIAKGGR